MKPERNKPCACGSGKKFKKCCWNPVRVVPAQIPPVPRDDNTITVSYRNMKRGRMMNLMLAAAALGAWPNTKHQ